MIAPKSDRAFLLGLKRIAASDPDVGRAFATHGRPPFRRVEPGYAALLRILIGQQVSTHRQVPPDVRISSRERRQEKGEHRDEKTGNQRNPTLGCGS